MIQKFTRLCDSAIPQSVASYITSSVSLPAWLPGVFFRVLCYQLTTAIEPNSCLCEDGEDFRQHCNYQKSNHCRWWCGSGECAVHGIHVTLKDCFESVWNCPVSRTMLHSLHYTRPPVYALPCVCERQPCDHHDALNSSFCDLIGQHWNYRRGNHGR